MSTQITFLRGVGHGPDDMLEMGELREALASAGLADVHTFEDGGNVVLDSDLAPDQLASTIQDVISQRFGRDVRVIVRTAQELSDVVALDPIPGAAADPEQYHVTFLDVPLEDEEVARLSALRVGAEQVVAGRSELYAWHPDGFAGSRLVEGIMGLQVLATARTWATVVGLLTLVDEVARHQEKRSG